jgi:hypothetical protein
MNEALPSVPGGDDPDNEDWGAARGYVSDGPIPVSRWPAPSESITTPAPRGAARRDGVSAAARPGPREKLAAVLAAFRGRRKRS